MMLANRSLTAKNCLYRFLCTLKNSNKHVKFQKQVLLNKSCQISVIKSFSCSREKYQGAKKLQEKQEILSINDYSKSLIRGVYLNEKGNILNLNFEKGEDLEYPLVWLRDNCQCNKCFDMISNSRVHERLSFTNDIIPKSITCNEDSVSIIWEDGHNSNYKKEWLCHHSFQNDHQLERVSQRHVEKVFWNSAEFMENFSKFCFKYEDVIHDDRVLLKWLETLATFGVAKLSDAPRVADQLHILARRVAYIRKTQYGEEYQIKGDDNANNVAYKKGALPLHTDLPYYHNVPGVVLLHFVVQSPNGGENILTDGINVARQLPKNVHEILSNTLVDWVDIGFENDFKFHSIYRAPVLIKDYLGNIERVNWSQPQRDSVFNVSAERALEWYEAFQIYYNDLMDRKNVAYIKNVGGDILTFDNRRIIHGRTDYTDGRRFLCGAFIDWDEIYSKIRVLRRDLE